MTKIVKAQEREQKREAFYNDKSGQFPGEYQFKGGKNDKPEGEEFC